MEISNMRTKTGKFLTKAVFSDGTGAVEAVWFNQPYLNRTLKKGSQVGLAGKVEPFSGRITLLNPEFEIIRGGSRTHTAGLVPVYPETARVSSKWLRNRVRGILSKLGETGQEEFIPPKYLKEEDLPSWKEALRQIHFPKNEQEAQRSRARFAFEELLLFNLRSAQRRRQWEQRKPAVSISRDRFQKEIARFIQDLPFDLTAAQDRALEEILQDLGRKVPMNRLLEGDVGSGKTVVAAAAAYLTYLNGGRTVFMAPTEVLADQHFTTLKDLLEPYGMRIAIRTGSRKPPDENSDLWIGTHALFYRKEKFEKAGLVVIDEQHRFGVEQRAELLKKSKQDRAPHVLTLTATPIPRTLALAVYGDLDLSVLDELPPGRKPVKTFVVPEEKRPSGYRWIHEKVKEGDQAFVICPLIEESEKESMQQVKAASAEHAKLQEMFPDLEVGLLHGRLKSREKEAVLGRFRSGKSPILVSTPVIEVGIDVPNATVMVIAAADRFGLASLHQLRGRVGRGEKESFCLLFSENSASLERLKALEKTSNGFELAELDLRLRGPGEIYGKLQHGAVELKVADLTDSEMLKTSQGAAQEL
ncbi:MAG: ATP-dependent DNA helicase RecG, partial [bacterium]|nr:ATP-dependent DNA helicase RecG [bacterium]